MQVLSPWVDVFEKVTNLNQDLTTKLQMSGNLESDLPQSSPL